MRNFLPQSGREVACRIIINYIFISKNGWTKKEQLFDRNLFLLHDKFFVAAKIKEKLLITKHRNDLLLQGTNGLT